MDNYLYPDQFDQVNEPCIYIIILFCGRYRKYKSSSNLHLVKLRLGDFPQLYKVNYRHFSP